MNTVNPLTNAGSWINFIRSVKNGTALKGFTTGNGGVPEERDTRSEIFRAGTRDN
ncbi:hypothetical protein D9M69_700200 [compost metagenome]